MKDKTKIQYVCTECGESSPRWMGRCPSCGAWNCMTEEIAPKISANKTTPTSYSAEISINVLSSVDVIEGESRFSTGISELDRVLGGGIVVGSVVLLGGEPGAGKSTLLLQVCGNVSQRGSVVYISGEESSKQVKLRADRLQVPQESILISSINQIEDICSILEEKKPSFAVIDSIQTMHCGDLSSGVGSVSQVKECSARLLSVAKKNDISIFIVGHVNKDGAIAGPKVMEHIVDTVLYFEGDRSLPYRVLRAAKNRYGSTNEIGMFDMTSTGLDVIENPSQLLLEGRPLGISGNCVCCVMEGTRPVLSEIQTLVSKSLTPVPRRTCSGFDYNRANLLVAVLEKRAGYYFGSLDIYLNVVGGLQLNEPACDLAVCMSLLSSLIDKPVGDRTVAIGEVGLGGEIRSVNNMDQRIHEAIRIGFNRIIVPAQCLKSINEKLPDSVQIIGIHYVKELATMLG